MSSGDQNRRQRRVLIDAEFQLGFVNRLAGWLFSYVVLCLVCCILVPLVGQLLRSGTVVPDASLDPRILLRLVALPLLITFVCIFVHGVRETFHIAGPKYRFEQVFSDLRHLRLPSRVRVRENDYLQDTAERLDECVQSLRSTVAELQGHSRDLQSALQSAAPARAGGTDLHRIRQAADRLHEVAMRFELLGVPQPAASLLEGLTPAQVAAAVEPLEEATAKR